MGRVRQGDWSRDRLLSRAIAFIILRISYETGKRWPHHWHDTLISSSQCSLFLNSQVLFPYSLIRIGVTIGGFVGKFWGIITITSPMVVPNTKFPLALISDTESTKLLD